MEEHPSNAAPTLEVPAKRQTKLIGCRDTPCTYHDNKASDAVVLDLQLLARDAAPYIVRSNLCLCIACMVAYGSGCSILVGYLISAVERYLDASLNIVEHEKAGQTLIRIRWEALKKEYPEDNPRTL